MVFAALTADGLRLARKAERAYHVALREHVFELVPARVLTELADGVLPLDAAVVEELLEAPAASTDRDPELPERRSRFAGRATS